MKSISTLKLVYVSGVENIVILSFGYIVEDVDIRGTIFHCYK